MDRLPNALISPRTIISPPAAKRPPRRGVRRIIACILLIVLVGLHHPAAWDPTQPVHHARFSPPIPYGHRYYFGGKPLRGTGTPLVLGPGATSIWARLLPWTASPPAPAPSCLAIAPPVLPGTVPRDIAADLPGLYGAPWTASFNGNLIAALHVTVPRDVVWQPAGPTFQIYRPGAIQPAFSQIVPVSVTRGSTALLYRMFINGPITCIDLTIPNGTSTGNAHLYYPFRGQMFEAEGVFTVER